MLRHLSSFDISGFGAGHWHGGVGRLYICQIMLYIFCGVLGGAGTHEGYGCTAASFVLSGLGVQVSGIYDGLFSLYCTDRVLHQRFGVTCGRNGWGFVVFVRFVTEQACSFVYLRAC